MRSLKRSLFSTAWLIPILVGLPLSAQAEEDSGWDALGQTVTKLQSQQRQQQDAAQANQDNAKRKSAAQFVDILKKMQRNEQQRNAAKESSRRLPREQSANRPAPGSSQNSQAEFLRRAGMTAPEPQSQSQQPVTVTPRSTNSGGGARFNRDVANQRWQERNAAQTSPRYGQSGGTPSRSSRAKDAFKTSDLGVPGAQAPKEQPKQRFCACYGGDTLLFGVTCNRPGTYQEVLSADPEMNKGAYKAGRYAWTPQCKAPI